MLIPGKWAFFLQVIAVIQEPSGRHAASATWRDIVNVWKDDWTPMKVAGATATQHWSSCFSFQYKCSYVFVKWETNNCGSVMQGLLRLKLLFGGQCLFAWIAHLSGHSVSFSQVDHKGAIKIGEDEHQKQHGRSGWHWVVRLTEKIQSQHVCSVSYGNLHTSLFFSWPSQKAAGNW